MFYRQRESAKIIMPSIAAVMLFAIAIWGIILPSFRSIVFERKIETSRDQTQTALSILFHLAERERTGEMSRDEAQRFAIDQLRELRYGPENKDYFWINDMHARMIMHPYRTDLEGQDLSGFTDANGTRLFQDFVNVVEKQGEGYVQYLWQWKDNPNNIVSKQSFVKGFKPWGWIIGTGIYLEDVHEDIEQISRSIIYISLAILVFVSILSSYIAWRALRENKLRRIAEEKLQAQHEHLEQLVGERTAELSQANEHLRKEIVERTNAEDIIRKQNTFSNTVIESLSNPFYVIDVSNHKILLANEAASQYGIEKGASCFEQTHGKQSPCNGDDHVCPVKSVMQTKKQVIAEHLHIDKDGREHYVEVHGSPIFDEAGEVIQMIEYTMDITERKQMEKRLHDMSNSDELTGLYNRRGFLTLADKQLKMAVRQKGELFLLYIDFDNMKWINDNLGHDAGDQAIIETAGLLETSFRESDIIGRIGGDEFVVLMSDKSGIDNEKTVVRRLREIIKSCNSQKNRLYDIMISIGIVRYDSNTSSSIEDLLSKADSLMYEHKKKKKTSHTGSYNKTSSSSINEPELDIAEPI